MRLARIDFITPGTILARTIYSETGQILLRQGTTITNQMLQRLRKLGISYIYIKDELTEGIVADSTLSTRLRLEAIQEIKSLFKQLNRNQLTEQLYLFNTSESKLANVMNRIIDEINYKDEALSLLADIFVTDNYTFQHSLNVSLYSIAIGRKLQLPNTKINELGLGAILHDIGKVFIAEDILKKPGKLTDEEFNMMKTHTELGFDYIRKHTDLPSVVAHCAYQHHERLDGSGYPRKLVGDQIHLYAQIIGIADVFDAVTSNRIYREAILPHEALEILYADAVYKFDQQLVEKFKDSIVVYPNGMTLELSDGRLAVVAEQNKYIVDRPFVRVIKENNHKVTPYEIDLSKKGSITIQACYMAS